MRMLENASLRERGVRISTRWSTRRVPSTDWQSPSTTRQSPPILEDSQTGRVCRFRLYAPDKSIQRVL